MISKTLLALLSGLLLSVSAAAAQFTADGKMLRPDIKDWRFLGASLGMGYKETAFNPEHPGDFQVVLMEPDAYDDFLAYGQYPEGAMFALLFYDSKNQISINRSGFVMGDMKSFEIHLKDASKSPNGRAFYFFNGDAESAAAIAPADNDCTKCHLENGAFDGTFAQFYPAIRKLIPADALKRALEKGKDGFE